jgi:hypothetical protein
VSSLRTLRFSIQRDGSNAYRAAIFHFGIQGSKDVVTTGRVTRKTLSSMRILVGLELKPNADLSTATGENAFRVVSADLCTHAELLDLLPDHADLIQTTCAREIPQGTIGWQVRRPAAPLRN